MGFKAEGKIVVVNHRRSKNNAKVKKKKNVFNVRVEKEKLFGKVTQVWRPISV